MAILEAHFKTRINKMNKSNVWLPACIFLCQCFMVPQSIAIKNLNEPAPLSWLLPVFAITSMDSFNFKHHLPDPAQTPRNSLNLKETSCSCDKFVTVVAPSHQKKTLEVFLDNSHLWKSSGSHVHLELEPSHQPHSLKYIDPKGQCHEHWVIPGFSKQTDPSGSDPEDPGNSTLISWLNDNPSLSTPFNVTQPFINDNDLDAIKNPLTDLLPDPYPLTVKYFESSMPVLFQDSIWLRLTREESLILAPSEFPAVTKVSVIADENWLQLIAAEYVDGEPGSIRSVFRFTSKLTMQNSVSYDPLLRFLALIFGAAFHVQDDNNHSSYIIRHNGRLIIISRTMIRLWLSQYGQSLLESLYPEIFGPFLPAGGGWHEWNRYVRKKPITNDEKPQHRPDSPKPERQPGILVIESRNQNDNNDIGHSPSTRGEGTPQNTASGENSSKKERNIVEIEEQLKKAKTLYDQEEYSRSIGVLIRASLRMDSLDIEQDYSLRKLLGGILNSSIFKYMTPHVFEEIEYENHEIALDNLRLLELIPVDIMSDKHIESMQSSVNRSGRSQHKPTINHLHERLTKEKDSNLVRQDIESFHQLYRQVISDKYLRDLAIAWCRSLHPLLNEITELMSNNSPLKAFNKFVPDAIEFIDLTGYSNKACVGTLRRVKGFLMLMISGVLNHLEQNPESNSAMTRFYLDYALLKAEKHKLINMHTLNNFKLRTTNLKQPRAVSPQEFFQVNFQPLYDEQHLGTESETHCGSVLFLISQVENYLIQGQFGKAMGLIIEIDKVTGKALPYRIKTRLYNQLRLAVFPLLYDLTLKINTGRHYAESQSIFNQLKDALGELYLELTPPQSYSFSWMEAIFLQHTRTAQLESDLEQIALREDLLAAQGSLETTLNSYEAQILTRRAVQINNLLQKIINYQSTAILENSRLEANWNVAIENLASLWRLVEIHSTVDLTESHELLQKVEDHFWNNITELFGITSKVKAVRFVANHADALFQSPDSLFYFAKLLEKKNYRGAAHYLYRTLQTKTDEQAIRDRCEENRQALIRNSP